MMHAPIWWYLWLGVVLLFGMISILRWRAGKRPHVPERHVTERLSAFNVHLMQLLDRDCGLELADEVERTGREPQVMAAALDEVDHAGRYAMALASHEPSFSPDAPVSPFDAGESTHMDV